MRSSYTLLLVLVSSLREVSGFQPTNGTVVGESGKFTPCTQESATREWLSKFKLVNGTRIPKFIFQVKFPSKGDEDVGQCNIDLSSYLTNLAMRVQETNSTFVAPVVVMCFGKKKNVSIEVTDLKEEHFSILQGKVVFKLQLDRCSFNASNLAKLRKYVPFITMAALHIHIQETTYMNEVLNGVASAVFYGSTNFINFLASNCCSSMSEVTFNNMGLSEVPHKLQLAMPNLQALDLTGNGLIKPPSFPWTTVSRTLPFFLERVPVYNVDYGTGLDLPATEFLRTLDLTSNSITNMSSPLHGEIISVILKSNGMKQIAHSVFQKLSKVQSIDISYNQLGVLPVDLFKGLQQLTRILADHNQLRVLPSGLLKHNGQLKAVDFRFNNLITIQPGALCCQNLETIRLSNNSLPSIKGDMFHTTPVDVKYVDLDQNLLTELPTYLLTLRELKLLNLTQNLITFDHSGKILNSIDASQLTNTFVTSWSSGEYPKQHPGDIRVLLKNNLVSRIDLSTTSNKVAKQIRKLRLILGIFSFDLSNNPIDCDCNFLPLVDLWNRYNVTYLEKYVDLTDRMLHAFNFNRPQFFTWQCQKPAFHLGRSIYSLRHSEFYCPYQGLKCPRSCDCWENTMQQVFVDCSNRSITAVPNTVPIGTTILSLERSAIHTLEGFSYFSTLRSLSVSRCGVTDIKPSFFAHFRDSSIGFIDLSFNKVQKVPRSAEEANITTLNLSNNNLRCDCTNRWMKNWLRQISRKQSSKTWRPFTLECTTGRDTVVQVVYAEDDDFVCPVKSGNDNAIIVAISASLGAVVLLALLCGITAYIYRVEIKILMYAKFNWHPFDKLDEDDAKEYDAFVSYSGYDVAWVKDILLPVLEDKEPHYKICVHDRDFKAGLPIDVNIMDAINSSRRMILVLSPSFVASEWCKLEFRMAHERVLRERQKYLIVVVLEDLDLKTVEEGLSAYLRTNTYLHADNKWFWKKLLYSMPTKYADHVDIEATAL